MREAMGAQGRGWPVTGRLVRGHGGPSSKDASKNAIKDPSKDPSGLDPLQASSFTDGDKGTPVRVAPHEPSDDDTAGRSRFLFGRLSSLRFALRH